MSDVSTESYSFTVEHVKITSSKPFTDTARALEAQVPQIDSTIWSRLKDGQLAEVRVELEGGPDLSIFERRDHGKTDAMIDEGRKCFQYEIGNPLTASKMTSHNLAAGLYAPLRIILYESIDGGSTFEYDRPSILFGQFGLEPVTEVARELDTQILDALTKAIQA